MQDSGHLLVKGEKILVLRRPNLKRGYVALKIRATGGDGRLLSDESKYLEDSPAYLAALRAGEVIRL